MSTNLDAPRAKIDGLIKTAIASKHPGTKIRFDNLKFEQPTGQAWLDVKHTPGKHDRADIGANNPRFFHWGITQINVMVPQDGGTKTHNAFMQTLFDTLADKSMPIEGGSLTLCCPSERDRGLINGFAVRSFLVEYRYRSVKNGAV